MKQRDSKRRCNRNGSVLIVLLACMSVMMVMLFGTLQMTISMRRQTQQERLVEQARCIVDAGIRYSQAKLGQDPGYKGEKIKLVFGNSSHEAELLIERIEQQDEGTVHVSAIIEGNGELNPSIKRSKTLNFAEQGKS